MENFGLGINCLSVLFHRDLECTSTIYLNVVLFDHNHVLLLSLTIYDAHISDILNYLYFTWGLFQHIFQSHSFQKYQKNASVSYFTHGKHYVTKFQFFCSIYSNVQLYECVRVQNFLCYNLHKTVKLTNSHFQPIRLTILHKLYACQFQIYYYFSIINWWNQSKTKIFLWFLNEINLSKWVFRLSNWGIDIIASV